MFSRILLTATFYVAVFLFKIVPISAQSGDPMSLAQSLEADGQFEKAVTIYEKLYQKDPSNIVVADRLKRAYKTLGKYELRERVLLAQIQNDSSQIAFWAELADNYYKLKRPERAATIIQKYISTGQNPIGNYRVFASILMENRRWDELERLYKSARKTLRNEKLFIAEMANLQQYRGDYHAATLEFLSFWSYGMGTFDYVRQQILQFGDVSADLDTIVNAVKIYIQQLPKEPKLLKLIGELQFKSGRMDAAFATTIQLDEQFQKQGTEILAFADMAFGAQRYTVAEEAYKSFLYQYPNAPQAEMGLARCWENQDARASVVKAFQDTSLGQAMVAELRYTNQAIEVYKNIAEKYKNLEWAAEAHYRLGEIYLNRMFDVDEAIRHYEAVYRNFAKNNFAIESLFRLGECHLIRGEIENSAQRYKEAMRINRTAIYLERAEFALAKIDFYNGHIDTCYKRMQSLAKVPNGLYVNDALSFILLLQESKKNLSFQKALAKSDLLTEQRKYTEALRELNHISETLEESRLKEWVLMRIGITHERLGQYNEAVSTFYQVLTAEPQSIQADLALKKAAEIYDYKLNRPDKAIQLYRQLLVKFPKSIFQNEIRKRLRLVEQALGGQS
ncbi:MAG TPA: tetratricopeptide repeat protein [bacterium]|nr:tetratricopeptide repeat protein [bacterium]